MIACHAIGMAIMVGLSVALNMRILGWFSGIPYPALHRFLGVAWIGFTINFLSGTALFTTQPTTYVTDFEFLLKMAFVVAGVVTVALLQNAVGRRAAGWAGGAAPMGVKLIAALSIVFWVGATVTGRLIAYL